MCAFKILDVMIVELIGRHSPVEMFVARPRDYLVANLLRALCLMMLHICISLSFAWVRSQNPYGNESSHSQFINGAGLCSLSKSSNICSLNMH